MSRPVPLREFSGAGRSHAVCHALDRREEWARLGREWTGGVKCYKAFMGSWLLCLLLRQSRGPQPGTWQATLQDSDVGQLCRPCTRVLQQVGAQHHPSLARPVVVLAEAESRFSERKPEDSGAPPRWPACPRTLFVLPVSSPPGVAKEARCDKCMESLWPRPSAQHLLHRSCPVHLPGKAYWVGRGEAECVRTPAKGRAQGRWAWPAGHASGVPGPQMEESGPRPRQLVRLCAG